jgi:glucosamine kinase
MDICKEIPKIITPQCQKRFDMILIADSGSTKTEWVLLDGKTIITQVNTAGVNPYFLSAEQIRTIFTTELIPGLNTDPAKISAIHYYGAGCSSAEKCAEVEHPLAGIFTNATIEVTHDLLGAARAACGHQQGIAAILGTGSNSCLFDGHQIIANQPSLGFIMGDEGSGGYIGKELLKQFLYGELPAELHLLFDQRYSLTKEAILHRIYKEPMPNTYAASFTQFVAEHIQTIHMQQLVMDAFDVFFKRHLSSYPQFAQYPISVVGSIGFVFEQQLRKVASHHQTSIHQLIQKPMEGLLTFHTT